MATGLYSKYDVVKDGETVEDCFVLRPDRDPAARVALRAYANTTDDLRLASDLREWLDAIYNAIAESEMEAVKLVVYEGIVADRTREVERTKRAADEAEFMLADAQRGFAIASGRKERSR